MSFDFSTLITDRSSEDLQALRDLLSTPMEDWTEEQLAQFNQAASKGAYNYTDLNRVIAAMDYLNERLTAAGYVTGYHPIIVHPETPPEPVGPLPEGYTQLEYIQSSGTQYIDTGFRHNQDTRIVMDAQAVKITANAWAFEGRISNSSARHGVFFYESSGDQWNGDYVTQRHAFTGIGWYDRLNVDFNKNTLTLNGSTYTFQAQDFQSTVNLALLAANTNGKIDGYLSARLYSCQIYDNGALIRDFVPCTNPSGAAGLYDRIGNQFYGNAGSGIFTAGPEVPAPEPTLDPYTWYEEDTPTLSQMQQYLANGAALRDALTMADDLPDLPPDMDELTQAEANDIEALLGTINDYLEAMQRIFLRSGMAWAISGGPNFYFVN